MAYHYSPEIQMLGRRELRASPSVRRGEQEAPGGDKVTSPARSLSSWPARKEKRASVGEQPRCRVCVGVGLLLG